MASKSSINDNDLKINHGKKQKFSRINLDQLLELKQSEYISKKVTTDEEENECNEMNNEQLDMSKSNKHLWLEDKLHLNYNL